MHTSPKYKKIKIPFLIITLCIAAFTSHDCRGVTWPGCCKKVNNTGALSEDVTDDPYIGDTEGNSCETVICGDHTYTTCNECEKKYGEKTQPIINPYAACGDFGTAMSDTYYECAFQASGGACTANQYKDTDGECKDCPEGKYGAGDHCESCPIPTDPNNKNWEVKYDNTKGCYVVGSITKPESAEGENYDVSDGTGSWHYGSNCYLDDKYN